MSLPRPETTALADISANIFAALILVLIIVIASGQFHRPATPPPPGETTIDLSRDLRTVTRPVLSPATMVEVLSTRAKPGPTINIEVTQRGISLALGGVEESIPLEPNQLEPTLARLRSNRATAVQVLVFDNANYAAVPALLQRLGLLAWNELSVPAALHGRDGGWSEGFRALIGRSFDTANFRTMLARLLAGGPQQGLGSWEEITGRPAPVRPQVSRPQLPSVPTYDFWLPALGDVMTTLAFLAAALFVWRVERRFLQRRVS